MRVLIIGYGSIGQRHYRILKKLGIDVAILSRRINRKNILIKNIDEIINWNPDKIIIATETSHHLTDLKMLQQLKFKNEVLVEKPIFANMENFLNYGFKIYVAYHFRFHPLIKELKKILKNKKILTVHCYVGQHLSLWRDSNVKVKNYSYYKNKGGGALRDLSHELDLMQYLFGKIKDMTASGGRFGNVTIDSDDTFGFLLKTKNCQLITLNMNMLDLSPKREIYILTDRLSINVDLIKGSLKINGIKKKFINNKDIAYISMHREFLYKKYKKDLCNFSEGMDIMKIIAEAENA